MSECWCVQAVYLHYNKGKGVSVAIPLFSIYARVISDFYISFTHSGNIAQTPHTFQTSFPVLFLRKWMSLLRKYLPKEEACTSL